MNQNESIKALECCEMQSSPACRECPYHDHYSNRNCISKRNADIKDRIKILNAENEELKYTNQKLTSENENLISDLKSAKAEIGRIRSELASWQINIHNDIRRNDVVKKLENKCNVLEFVMIPELVRKAKSEIRKAVSEAYREFAERLKAKGTSPELDEGKYYSDYDIDRTLEEMESERG